MKILLPLLMTLFLAIPAKATFSIARTGNNGACGTVSACTVTMSGTVAAGSFVVAIGTCGLTTCAPSAGSSNVGTWTIPSGCTTNSNCADTDATAGGEFVLYIPSSTGSSTTISVTCTTANITGAEIFALTFTGSSVSFDVGNVHDYSTAAANLAGISPGTLTGTNDAIFQGGTFSGTASGCPNSGTEADTFPNGNAWCVVINTTSNAAGTWANTSSRAAVVSIAFKEASSGASVSGFSKERRYEEQDEGR